MSRNSTHAAGSSKRHGGKIIDADFTLNIYRIINYLRRSRQDIEREKRTGEDTLAIQKRIMAKVLDDLGIPYDQVEEIGSGDRIETRPVFQQVLADLEQGKYNAIAAKEISRLGRGSYKDMGRIYDLLVTRRIYIITPYKIYDPQNPADAQQIRFALFFAREEFEMIKERLISAKYNLAHEGRWMSGITPFGYRLNPHTGRLEVVEEEAQVVRLIFALYVHGIEEEGITKDVSFRAIASYLTRMGVPTPGGAKSWNYMTVRRIIQNEVYIGTAKYRTSRRVDNKYYPRPQDEWIVVADAHEPIIDPETWFLAQQKFRSGRNLPNVKLDFSPCELAGLVVCAKCGRRMVRQYSVQRYRKKNGEISKYHKEFLWCPTPGCTTVKYRDVEAAILEYLKTLGSFDVQRLKEIFGEVYNKQREAAATIDTDELVEKKRAELKRRLKFICEKYEAGIYDDETFLERKGEIEKELSLLESIPTRKSSEPEPERDMLVLRENINTFLSAYQAAENKTLKNKLLRELISVVYLDKTGKGKFDLSIYPRFTFGSGESPQK
ncbi:recombinase family protein [Desulfofundulus thermosubterraneus]|uniref:Site-specific DNA recombinase n=1 Tax=Desulfofundulus thermosubterraneus DSM 16057 TaxID=1121432 RepID=A0A1M6KZ47_9FIRM|nr:recombinase family protein [Desulfofundulus thermosubterraneus]SHJ64126.1 Site-specific DNA recombinase [Desulfofundulus thermosubterraneus DSM 16057]